MLRQGEIVNQANASFLIPRFFPVSQEKASVVQKQHPLLKAFLLIFFPPIGIMHRFTPWLPSSGRNTAWTRLTLPYFPIHCCFIFLFIFCYYQKFQQCIIKSQGTLVNSFLLLSKKKDTREATHFHHFCKEYACRLLLREVCFWDSNITLAFQLSEKIIIYQKTTWSI